MPLFHKGTEKEREREQEWWRWLLVAIQRQLFFSFIHSSKCSQTTQQLFSQMSPFCMGHCAHQTRLSRFCSPWTPPPTKKIAVLSSKYLQRNRTYKESFSSSPCPPPPFFFLLHAAWTIWLCSGCIPVAHSLSVPCAGLRTVDQENTGPHSDPGRRFGRGVGGRKVNQMYLWLLRHQLNTWAERQRLFRKSPGCRVTHLPHPPGVQKITGAEN